MRRIFLFFFCLCCLLPTKAQETQRQKKQRTIALWGHVKDSFTKSGIPDVKVTLMTEDSAIVDSMRAFNMGKFNATKIDVGYRFYVPAHPARYIIMAEHSDYETGYVDYEIRHVARNSYFDAPWHLLKRRPRAMVTDSLNENQLDEVVIKATRVRMVYKGDTIVYNADAFNLPEGSMLDALIRQMDGVELKDDGRILVNGQQIDELTLNGKDFFRGNNKVMLENLPHYVVNNIQVYHKSTELSQYLGRDVEQKKYVMDVVLKREYAEGFLGNVEVAASTSDRFLGRLFGMRYTDNSRLTLFGNANNVNENRRPGSNGEWTPSNMPQGRQTTGQAGMDLLIDEADKRWKENASVTLNWSKFNDQSLTNSERFFANAPSNYSFSRASSLIRNLEMHASNRFELMKPFHLLSFTEVRYDRNNPTNENSDWLSRSSLNSDSLNSQWSSLNTQLSSLIHHSVMRSRQHVHRVYAGSYIELTKKLLTGDEIGVTMNANFHNQHQEANSLQRVEYIRSDDENVVKNRRNRRPDKEYSWYVMPNYTVTWLNGISLRGEVSYNQQYNSEANEAFLLDSLASSPSPLSSSIFSTDLYNSFEYGKMQRRYTMQLRPSYNYNKNGKYMAVMLQLPLNHVRERMKYFSAATDTVVSQRSWTFSPNFFLRAATHEWTRQYTLSYTVKVELPSLYNKIDVHNNENPLVVRQGNPALKKSVSHLMQASFTRNWRERQQAFTLGYGLRFFVNTISQGYTYYPETGIYVYRPQNVKGNWQTYFWNYFNRPLDKPRRLTLNNYVHGDYSRNVDVAVSLNVSDAQTLSHVDNYYVEDRLTLNYRLEELSIGAQGYMEYRYASNKEKTIETIRALNYSYGLTCNYNFKKDAWGKFIEGFALATDIKMFSRRGYGNAALNSNDLVWNASVSRSFPMSFAKKSGGTLVARLEAFDILHKLSNTQIVINGQGRTETVRNTLPRYVMLHLSYNFNRIPQKR